MIDPKVFKEMITVLGDHFGKKIENQFVFETFYSYLDDELTSEELVNATRRAIINCKFMPTPKELVELVHGSTEERAITEFHIIANAAMNGEKYLVNCSVSDRARTTARIMGGILRLSEAPEKQIPFLKKQFVEIYKQDQVQEVRPSLPPSYEKDEIREVSEAEIKNNPIDWASINLEEYGAFGKAIKQK